MIVYTDPNLYAEILKYYQHYHIPQPKQNDRTSTRGNTSFRDNRGRS